MMDVDEQPVVHQTGTTLYDRLRCARCNPGSLIDGPANNPVFDAGHHAAQRSTLMLKFENHFAALHVQAAAKNHRKTCDRISL